MAGFGCLHHLKNGPFPQTNLDRTKDEPHNRSGSATESSRTLIIYFIVSLYFLSYHGAA